VNGFFRCVRQLATGLLADIGIGGFRYGVRVIHTGVLIDQRTIAGAVRSASTRVAVRRHLSGSELESIVRRITVVIGGGRPGKGLVMQARWTGGYRDRGLIQVDVGEGYVEAIARGIEALIETECGAALSGEGGVPARSGGESSEGP